MTGYREKVLDPLNKASYVTIYRVMEIPDAYYQPYQVIAGGEVLSAVKRDFEHLMHSISNLFPSSASVSIIFLYIPDHKSADLQERLRLYLEIRTNDQELATNLAVLLERGPPSRFYPLRQVSGIEIPWEKFGAISIISRRQEYISPLHSAEYNDKIPPSYFRIQSFSPNDRNDYLDMDRVLGGLDVPVLIVIRIIPVNIHTARMAHTRYLARIESINRDWGRGEDEIDIQNIFNPDTAIRSPSTQTVRPLRRRDPLADDILRSQRQFHETLYQPQLEFAIQTIAPSQSVTQLIGSLLAESAFKSGSYRLVTENVDFKEFSVQYNPVPPVIADSSDLFTGVYQLYSPLEKLLHTATVEELSGLFCLPTASVTSPCCIRKNTDPPDTSKDELIFLGNDRTPFVANDKGLIRGPLTKNLCKNMFISGAPGGGKTTSALNILLQLYAKGIPFLVIEPVKTEYRIIKALNSINNSESRRLAEALEVYTPGSETISPFRLNPLLLQPGITDDEHIENLLNCFFAAMPATWPLPALIGEGLERVYKNLDSDTTPVIADLIKATEHVLASKGYSPETSSDIRAAMEVRLGVLARRTIGKVFQCNQNIPSIQQLMQVPALIELDRLPPEQASLLTLFLFTMIREYLRAAPQSKQNPRYVIVLEEAHRIAGAKHKVQPSADVADPTGHATEIICQGLVELRGLNVGIIIIDQFPSAVAPEVIKSTTTKLAFRQVAQQDREELGATMLFGQTEMEEIARLGVGEAFFITEGYYKPCKIQTVNLHNQIDFSVPIANEKIIPYLKGDNWYRQAYFARKLNELSRLKADMDIFDGKRIEINRQFIHLLAQDPRLKNNEKTISLNQLVAKINILKKSLRSAFEDFSANSYRKYYPKPEALSINFSELRSMRNDLEKRYETIIQPDVGKAIEMMDAYIKRCSTN